MGQPGERTTRGILRGGRQSSDGDEFVVADDDGSMARVAVKVLVAVQTADGCAAPWTVAAHGIHSNDGTDERGENAGDDHGYAEECAESGEAEHGSNDEADGRDDEAEEESGESGADGRGFHGMGLGGMRFCGRVEFVGDGDAAAWAEAPGGLKRLIAVGAGGRHGRALLAVHHVSTGRGARM